LDEKKLTKEKYNLIKEISANYNIDEFVKSPISNYKILASIYKIFESNITKTEYDRVDVLNANFTITENIINASVKNKGDKLKDVVIEEYKKQSDDVRSLTYNLMIEKFNNKYKGLSDSQKLVLREYINNINNTGKLKQFVSEQISSIISELKVIEKKLTDKVTKIKLNETIETVKKIKGIKSIRENHMSAVMMAYELIKELKSKL
jgi:hypothetical protein